MSKNGLRNSQQWSCPCSKKYLQLAARFSRLLQLYIHLIAGMPRRASEVASIKYQNIRQVMRNVFIYNYHMAIITEYQKARSQTNHAFYVIRILPPLVSQILFRYLVYIQPFKKSLAY